MSHAAAVLLTDRMPVLPDGTTASATGLLRCISALAQEAGELGMSHTSTALYRAVSVCLHERLTDMCAATELAGLRSETGD